MGGSKMKAVSCEGIFIMSKLFVEILGHYLEEYKLPLDLRRDWEKQFATGEESEEDGESK